MTELKINEYSLRFIGKTAISGNLERSVDYQFKITAAVPKASIEDNDDGTVDVIYNAKLISCEAETKTGKVKSVASKKWSKSQRLRFRIENYFDEQGVELEKETFYDLSMEKIIEHFPEIISNYFKP